MNPIDTPVLQSIVDIANHYRKATGIACSILSMPNPSGISLPCSLCHTDVEEDCPEKEQCIELHCHNALQSERFGGSYIYFCRCSLLFWASPVIIDGVMGNALVAGPVLILDPLEVIEELKSQGKALSEKQTGYLGNIKRIEISEVHSLSELLRMCAGWASGYQEHRMVETRQDLLQQSKLAEYMQELNQRGREGLTRTTYYPLAKEQELQEAIRLGDRQTAQELMNELLGVIFFVSGNTLERIKFRVMELVILLSRAAVQGGASEQDVMEISYRCQRELGQYRNMEEIARWLSGMLHQYTDLVFEQKHIKHANAIMEAIHFMRHHYTGKITLGDVSAEVGMSPTYFSKVFNEEMGCTFSTYINRLRVEHAKSLLMNTRYTLVEIAGCVGFEDQGYFSRIFKSSVGISPGSYRKHAGMFPEDTQEIHTH